MERLVERFCRYVRIDTQSDESSRTRPSTARQLDLSRLLADECRAMGLADVALDPAGIVLATLPATTQRAAPAIAWIAHVDTSPEASGANVRPQVHRNYDGGDIVLPEDPAKVLRVADNPDLARLRGGTIITSGGATLLGADDKAGVAVVMEAAERLRADRAAEHGVVRLCFTCDEEIGRSADDLDLGRLGAHVAYTLDGEGQVQIDCETFSADLAVVTVRGINTHPSRGKGAMVNAVRLLADFVSRLPRQWLSPETTDGRDGFLHPYRIEGGVAEASARMLLRDFETAELPRQAELLHGVARVLRAEHPKAQIGIEVTPQYRNMREGLAREPRAVEFAELAMRRAGLEPRRTSIRGGTDGSHLTQRGLPTPNLSTGEHNPHSILEWTSAEEMEAAVRVLIELARLWGRA